MRERGSMLCEFCQCHGPRVKSSGGLATSVAPDLFPSMDFDNTEDKPGVVHLRVSGGFVTRPRLWEGVNR